MDTKYQKSKIYKVINDQMPGLVYIGSTVNALSKRLSQHRAPANRARSRVFQQCGKMEIFLIENFPCNTRDELVSRERYYVENTDCINKQIPGRTKKEYRDGHKEEISEYMKIYRDENKEILNEKKKEVCVCVCGRSYTKSNKFHHEKSTHHIDYVYIQQTLASN